MKQMNNLKELKPPRLSISVMMTLPISPTKNAVIMPLPISPTKSAVIMPLQSSYSTKK